MSAAGPGFKDHFSRHASQYRTFRPVYPLELFRLLAEASPGRQRAWDCATGNGQAAVALAEHFGEVLATDASRQQIEQAEGHPRVRYRIAPAESCGLEAGSVELITVAQAFHWLDRPRFFEEVRKVARPRAVLAVWCYSLARISREVDRVVERLYGDIVGSFWPPERILLEEGYRSLPFPFPEIPLQAPPMEVRWTFPQLLGYLGTWSSVERYRRQHGRDPLDLVVSDLSAAWGPADSQRTVRWPVALRAGVVA